MNIPKIIQAFRNGEGFDYIDELQENCNDIDSDPFLVKVDLATELEQTLKDEKEAFNV